ncbi:hypothetical protein [Labrenzia sp. OB1]|uniref:hypothetical protein n=1 Tax=Labrenzia sp. OB1 TaxID=1561204 RepID=UPI0007B2F6EF|nr:hypothetical protein [Labrenzia sp. OB1]KZM47802.1 hypothetical protein OA90_23690 [Labrenzia sp. OB1]
MNRIGRNAGRLKLPRDPLFRLLAINGIAGVAVAGLVLSGIFWSNIGNLRVLVLNSEDPVLPVVMLAVALVITLGSVVIGSAIMLLGESDTGGAPPLRYGRMPVKSDLKTLPVVAGGRRGR